jgi:hypothetical protein
MATVKDADAQSTGALARAVLVFSAPPIVDDAPAAAARHRLLLGQHHVGGPIICRP